MRYVQCNDGDTGALKRAATWVRGLTIHRCVVAAGTARLLAETLLAGTLLAGTLLTSQAACASTLLEPPGGHSSHGTAGYVGINFRDVSDDQAIALKLKDSRGAEIVLIDHDGPAFRSGLREHDVIVQMNGQAIDGEDSLRRMLHDTPAGRTVIFVISRDGQQQTLSTHLANRETVGQEAWERHITVPEPVAANESSWHGSGFFGGGGSSSVEVPRHGFLGTAILSSSYTGALLEMMGPQLASYFGSQGGLLVRAVDPNSPAAIAGMRAGDVVLKIDAMPVTTNADWIKTVHGKRGKPLAVVVLRDRKEQIMTLTPDAKKRSCIMPHMWPGAKARAEATVGTVRPLPGME